MIKYLKLLIIGLLMITPTFAIAADETLSGNLLFSPDATYKIGASTSASRPHSIFASNYIYSGGLIEADNLLIGSSGASFVGSVLIEQLLYVNRGIKFNTAVSRPTCNDGNRGIQWFTLGGSGVKDALEICAKDAGDAYAWRLLY